MIQISLGQADILYEVARYCDSHPAVSTSISDPSFRRFAVGLKEFEQELGPAASDQFWIPLLRRLKRHRFEWSTVPLRFGSEAFGSPDTFGLLNRTLLDCRSVQPAFLASLEQLRNAYTIVAGSNANPLGEALQLLLEDRTEDHQCALLLNAGRLVREVRADLLKRDGLSELKIVTPRELAAEACYELLVVMGAPGWFPSYVFSAPRALETHVVHWDWMRISLGRASLFLSSDEETKRIANAFPGGGNLNVAPEGRISDLQAEDVLPQTDWSAISSNLAPTHEQGDVATETRLVLLANGFGAFLDAADSGSVYVIDPDSPDLERIRRVHSAELSPGMYVLLRSEGGGDYVASIANNLLGGAAAKLRGIQQTWKQLLRDKVLTRGISQVAAQLQALGLERASETNLRHWMSESSLRTEDPADFNKLMRFLGLHEEAKEYWEAMESLDRAHRKAGFHIRRLLLTVVLRANFRNLEREGRMDFQLPDADGGALTAFRVEQISPDTSSVAHSRVGRPFRVEPDLWQG